jgi:hypothetical protein
MLNCEPGNYVLTARATDNTNQTVVSEPVNFVVKPDPASGITYFEDFNDGLAQDWLPLAGNWAIEADQYHHTTSNGIDNAVYNGTTFADFTFSAKLKSDWDNNFGLIFNYQDVNNYYFVELDANPQTAKLKRLKNGAESTVATSNYSGGGAGIYVTVEIRNDGKTTAVKINGSAVFSAVSTIDFTYGKIGFYTWYNPVWFDDVDVKAKGRDFSTNASQMLSLQANLIIYPNPVTGGNFTVKCPAESGKPAQLRVYSSTGLLVHSEYISDKSFTVSTKKFHESGMYLVQLVQDGHVYFGKIIIEKNI